MRWIVVSASGALGAWMAFDGMRALVLGDFVRIDGELGPWARLVESAGLDPLSWSVRGAVALLGIAWLGVAVAAIADARWAPISAVVLGLASLWYVPFGSLLGAAGVVAAAFWMRR